MLHMADVFLVLSRVGNGLIRGLIVLRSIVVWCFIF